MIFFVDKLFMGFYKIIQLKKCKFSQERSFEDFEEPCKSDTLVAFNKSPINLLKETQTFKAY